MSNVSSSPAEVHDDPQAFVIGQSLQRGRRTIRKVVTTGAIQQSGSCRGRPIIANSARVAAFRSERNYAHALERIKGPQSFTRRGGHFAEFPAPQGMTVQGRKWEKYRQPLVFRTLVR
jgi:hypothetical protein